MHVLDAIHTRMGAADNLAMGRSTFLEVILALLTLYSLAHVSVSHEVPLSAWHLVPCAGCQ